MIYDIDGNEMTYPNEWNGDYVISPDFTNHPINVQEISGSKIYGHQSFCKYNGYWYSARDNQKLWKQDADFNIVTEKTIDLGHANSFQVGNSNIAYVWGWDDSNIYCLNLDTMEIDETIALPLTGYTTGVVDDARGLAYIFQRESYPTTFEYYNYVIYDLLNENIVSTRKTSTKFKGLQACDFQRDKIFLIDAEETARDGNTDGYKIYDTFGNLVAQYYLPTISSIYAEYEPEGVWIDRSNDDVYITVGYYSWDSAKLFKVTSY